MNGLVLYRTRRFGPLPIAEWSRQLVESSPVQETSPAAASSAGK
jgi:hypothetical protein